MTSYVRRLTPERITALTAAWADFTVHRRHVWTLAPYIERRFYRSQDARRYAADCAQLASRIAAGVRGLTAAVRRICGRDAQVVPLGSTRAGMPTCFLVRVPNGHALVPEELLLGEPHKDDTIGHALLAQREHAQMTERAQDLAASRQQAHYDKMVEALTSARTHLAMKSRIKGQALLEHGPVRGAAPPTLAVQRRLTYFHHGRAARCMARAVRYKNKLARLGLVYDLASISTTVVLPEEGDHGEPQGDSTSA